MKHKLKDKDELKLNSQKIREREIKIKALKIGLLIMLLFLIIIYFILRIVYELGDFTITLDGALAKKTGLVMYENSAEKESRKILKATKVEFMDNISYRWLPDDLDNQGEGSHNGDNYLAYTFFIENMGSDPTSYWYEIAIDDIVKNVDKAVRVRLYLNGEYKTYARPNEKTGDAEEGTEKFYSSTYVCVNERRNIQPGEIDRYTVVVYIEGDDPDCIDALIGGAMKMHMDITEEFVDENTSNIQAVQETEKNEETTKE